ncbi:MAG: hypothetical protein DRP03_02010 [Candidatus Aenigmatarchaeota archaeon]|nr:MAG: hypothetical protein DRP03_02010 [Candidatus Aenigmarchaeota archaeon]
MMSYLVPILIAAIIVVLSHLAVVDIVFAKICGIIFLVVGFFLSFMLLEASGKFNMFYVNLGIWLVIIGAIVVLI